MKRACVTGAAGFIGGRLCHYLKERDYWVRAVDYVEPRYGDVPCNEGVWDCDLRISQNADAAVVGCDLVFALGADMGGAGFVFTGEHDFDIIRNNALINVNTANACRTRAVERVLFTSSACVYPEHLQAGPTKIGGGPLDEVVIQLGDPMSLRGGLKEEDAWNGKVDSAYGVEKLLSEELYIALGRETGIEVRIARFHNVFGPRGSWNDGREKVPAAMCRKVAEAKLSGNHEIEIWGDGEQVRSFCYIDDCLEMLYRLMQSDYGLPLNIGTDRAVSINELTDIVADIAGIRIAKKHVRGPQGVRSRNADLSKMREVLNYEPAVSLEDGLARTYVWIESQVRLSEGDS